MAAHPNVPGLVVTDVSHSVSVRTWNEINPSRPLRVGQVVLQVNGTSRNSTAMVEELRKCCFVSLLVTSELSDQQREVWRLSVEGQRRNGIADDLLETCSKAEPCSICQEDDEEEQTKLCCFQIAVQMDHGRRVDLELDPLSLVPGDIIFLQAGDRIPADVRILHCTDGTEVDNSALTGESIPEPRHNKTEPVTCPPEARNLAFGTTVLKAEQLQGAAEFSVITGEELAEIEEGNDETVANKKDFFHEIDEVRSALKQAVAVDLPQAMCRETCERIGQIWSQYQEQPALLDPFMEEMVEPLMATIAAKVRQKDLDPNLHLLSSLMYLLTTVRGYKTVVRLFPHEAADLEPCLEAAEEEAKKENLETWSTLYCLTLWLGMVLLTPFDLSTIDSGHESRNSLSARIFALALQGLRSTSRTRDASAWMLAKFFGRPDVSGTGLLQSFVTWTRDAWVDQTKSVTAQVFVKSGALQAWNQTLKLAPRSVMSGLWTQVLRLVLDGPSGSSDDFGSSNLRKLRVAVACRAALVILPPRLAPWRYERGQRSLLVNFAQATGGSIASVAVAQGAGANEASGANMGLEEDGNFGSGRDDEAPEEVEEELVMEFSRPGQDTIVRWAAAKGIGRITNRLSRDFGDQVLESLLERCFSFRETDKAWHGGCLALAELTRRGLLLPERLSTVMPLVCQALHFEQVSGNFTSGQHVRDAACYVCWAFARAYAPDVLQPYVVNLASALIQVAVFDREINCRRAAAAAVQENVGRQGTFPDGIEVVTIADYWTLSGRRQAYLEVAPKIAMLGNGGYRKALMEHLVDRKLSHQESWHVLAGRST
eukprot:s61_g28.t1